MITDIMRSYAKKQTKLFWCNMQDTLRKLAILIRDLLTISESFIKIGRHNFEDDNFGTSYITVDNLAPATLIAYSEEFDGATEDQTLSQLWNLPAIVTFWGDNAYTNLSNFTLLLKSQKALELQTTLGIACFSSNNITDVKLLGGKQYNNRIELNLNINFNLSVTVDTLRIDTAQTDFIYNK